MSLFLAVYRFPGTSETSLSVFLDLTWSALLYHVDLFLAVPTRSEIRGLLLVDWLIAILRYVAIGMLVAALYRHLARSEEHTSELQSLMRISYAVFCLKKKKKQQTNTTNKRTQIDIINTRRTTNIHDNNMTQIQ